MGITIHLIERKRVVLGLGHFCVLSGPLQPKQTSGELVHSLPFRLAIKPTQPKHFQ